MGSLFKKKKGHDDEGEQQDDGGLEPYDGDPVADLKKICNQALRVQSPFSQRIADICEVNEISFVQDQRAAVDLEQSVLLWLGLISSNFLRWMPMDQLQGSLTQALEESMEELSNDFRIQWLQRGANWLASNRGEKQFEAKWKESGIPFDLPSAQGPSRSMQVQILVRIQQGLGVLCRPGLSGPERISHLTRPVLKRIFDYDQLSEEQDEVLTNMVEPVLQKILGGRIV